jgi:hypothetical protein
MEKKKKKKKYNKNNLNQGTAKVITYFILSLKPNLPEVSKS